MTTANKTVRFFWQQARRYPWHVAGLAVSLPVAVFCHQFIPSLVVASIIERLGSHQFTQGDAWGSFGQELLLYGGALILGSIFLWRLVVILIWKLEARVIRDIHIRVFHHLLGMSLNFHSDRFGGSLVSQANKLAAAYVRLADTALFQIYNLLVIFVFTASLLFPRAPQFTLLLLLFSAIFMVSSVFITRVVRRLGSDEASADNIRTGFLADAITNIAAVKSFSAAPAESQRYAAAAGTTMSATFDLMRASTRRDFFFSTVTTVTLILALVMGVIGVVVWGADIGTVFLMMSLTTVIAQKLWEFSQQVLRNINRGLADAKEMIEILDIPPEVRDPKKPEKPRITRGDITFDHVDFTHAGSHKNDALFRNLNLRVRAGEKIGLVGHSGSGKTTLTRLLLRFSDIDGGAITIDGQNIARITQDDLRAHIAYVPQEPLLFHRTITENISYGQPEASENEVKAAAERAHAAEFIEKLPKGYNTLVGERGVKLSGGQRQRIAIARAILKNAPILVLDEATSALDSESERLIQAALWELMKGRTTIVIAHRLSTIQRMDRIVVLDDGAILEEGTHQQLLEHSGAYAQLWSHQSGGFIEE